MKEGDHGFSSCGPVYAKALQRSEHSWREKKRKPRGHGETKRMRTGSQHWVSLKRLSKQVLFLKKLEILQLKKPVIHQNPAANESGTRRGAVRGQVTLSDG